jgi:hypothetical protein
MTHGNRKLTALRLSLSALFALAGLYVFCLIMGLDVDATVFTAFATAVGVITGSFNWANGKEHERG